MHKAQDSDFRRLPQFVDDKIGSDHQATTTRTEIIVDGAKMGLLDERPGPFFKSPSPPRGDPGARVFGDHF